MRRFTVLLFCLAGGILPLPAMSPQDIRAEANRKLAAAPGLFSALFNLGYASYLLGDYETSLREFQTALPHASDNIARSAVWYNMGNASFMLKKIPDAVTQYKNGLRLNPDDRELQYNYTVARMLQQQQQQQQQNKQDNKDSQDKKDRQQQQGGQDRQQPQRDKQAGGPKQMSKEDAKRILEALRQQEGKRLKARQLKVPGGGKPDRKEW